MGGFFMTGTLLRVDLSSGKISREPIAESLWRQFVGGRGLASKLLADNMDPSADALAAGNPLIFATGPLTGTLAPTGGRYAVVTKSPLTGAIACSNSGGYFGPALRYCGYDFLMVEGAAKEPVYLWINDGTVEIRSAQHLWGKPVNETEDLLLGATHPDARVASIGPAGENLALVACVMNDKGRAAGRSGVGAVMGAKKLKAVVAYGTKGVRMVRAPQFLGAARTAVSNIAHSPLSTGLNTMGTAGTIGYMNMVGILPTFNFQKGRFAGADKINGERVKTDFLTRTRGCHSCTISCGRVTKITGHGKLDGHGEGPEYETLFGLGTTCGVDNLAAIIKANYLCNELGMDTIEAGCAIATAMELAEKGYIPEKDIGRPLRFGDATALIELTEAMAHRIGFGHLLADGGYRVAQRYGHPELFIGSKKQAFAAYDPRGALGMGLGYATSNRGACHLRGYSISLEHFGNPVKLDPFTANEKAFWMCILQNQTSFVDASGVCIFSTMAMGPESLAAMVNDATGFDIGEQEMQLIGERIWNLERLFNNKAGLSRKDDSLPPRMLEEPLTEGAAQGHTVPLQPMLEEYYQQRGWDPEGRPTKEKLAQLALL
ncbi:MAG: aldehyde ferredoxin oxidoreductase family protein [Deltaproteobacteria bacterium]|nr:aldehyde ferredoxin oxidoreductase family protein [Deltaproteobacteria bacterium]